MGGANAARLEWMDDDHKDRQSQPEETGREFDNAAIGALAHLYRGEVYRSTVWRTRLDTTTNWAVVTLGIALSISYANPDASPLPLLLVSILIVMFLILESRRYRFFNVWRARARWIETKFYAPLLLHSRQPGHNEWQHVLANDYLTPEYHIGFWRAMGRRIRRNYMWILSFQAVSYYGKIIIHPTPVEGFDQFFARMAVGPISGVGMFIAGVAFHASWIALALFTRALDKKKHANREGVAGMG